jgi:hypothetical protein
LREIKKGTDEGTCPLCTGNEDAKLIILLSYPERKEGGTE